MKNILEYELGTFFVPHRKGADGKYHILKHEPWYVTDAYICLGNVWAAQVQGFDGWVQAIRYLKENIGDLI